MTKRALYARAPSQQHYRDEWELPSSSPPHPEYPRLKEGIHAASTPVLIPVEKYLRPVYWPDRNYIDGEVLKRNMGEMPHARLQTFSLRYFATHEDEWQTEALPELRVQVAPTRYRIPDVLLAALSTVTTVSSAPHPCSASTSSSRDTLPRIQERADD